MGTYTPNFKAAAIATLVAGASLSSDAQAAPTTLVAQPGQLKVLLSLPKGKRSPNGPEFIVQFKNMYEGDYTYNKHGVQGRAIDCDDMVVKQGRPGEWTLTMKFLANSFDILDGGSYDSYKEKVIADASLIGDYKGHINLAHHSNAEMRGVEAYCQKFYPPK